MNRRQLLLSLAGGAAASGLAAPAGSRANDAPPKTKLGIVLYALGIRQRHLRSLGRPAEADSPLDFLNYCHQLGAGGIQLPLGVLDATDAGQLREAAEQRGMFIEGIAGLPHQAGDVDRFAAQLSTAAQAGARVVRVVIIPGRRYERFDSLDEFREFERRGIRSLELAEPAAARHRVRLAVENHKDQRIDARVALFRRISSEYVGACVDTGNSFALLEDPLAVIDAYAPYAASVHLKDQGVCEYEEGFLFADVPLGDGFLDLQTIVERLRKAQPAVHFSLEMITRDPLKVPCLKEKYWSTLAEVPASDLARTLRVVRANADPKLPEISGLPLAEQMQVEDQNVRKCLAYAREELGL